LYRIEVNMLRWVCGFELKDWKFNAEIGELFRRLENGRLIWFGCVKDREDASLVIYCITVEFDGTRQK